MAVARMATTNPRRACRRCRSRRYVAMAIATAPNGIGQNNTWKKLSKDLPDGTIGRIAVAAAPSNPDRVYALIETRGVVIVIAWGVTLVGAALLLASDAGAYINGQMIQVNGGGAT